MPILLLAAGLAIAAALALANRKGVSTSAGGGLVHTTVPPPHRPAIVNGGPSVDPKAVAAGGVLAAAAVGAAAGAGAAAFDNAIHSDADSFAEGTSSNPSTTRAVDVPAGAGLGAAAIGGAFAVGGASLAALFIFPVAVGVFALTELGRAVETLFRNAEDMDRIKRVNALVGTKQYAAGFALANQDALDGFGGHGFRLERGDTSIPSDDELGDGVMTYRVDGSTVRVADWLVAAYGPAIADAHRDAANVRDELEAMQWEMARADDFRRGDAAAAELELAQPWWMPGSFDWRPVWPAIRAKVAAARAAELAAVGGATVTGRAAIAQGAAEGSGGGEAPSSGRYVSRVDGGQSGGVSSGGE